MFDSSKKGGSHLHPVTKARRKRKEQLVYIMGGSCCICGYNRCSRAMEFHHVDPTTKKRNINAGFTASFESDIEEARKCALLCNRCHSEVEEWNIPVDITFDEERYQEVLHTIQETKRKPTIKYCAQCGVPISSKATICAECYSQRTACVPSRDELKSLVRTLPFTTIASRYNVSDKAVVKWCVKQGLPSKRSVIKAMTEEEWETI